MAFGTPMAVSMIRTFSEHHHMPFHSQHHNSSTESFPQVPSIEIMAAPGGKRQSRDTGFPEPFNENRNTTLPYPGADLSPNARITMDDGLLNSDTFSSKKSFRRSRLNRHKRTVSHGKITPQFEALHSVMSIIDATSGMTMSRTSSGGTTRLDTGTTLTSQPSASTSAPEPASAAPPAQPLRVPSTPLSASFSSPRTSRDEEETDSFGSKQDLETPPSSPESHTSRKGGFLGRWRRGSRG